MEDCSSPFWLKWTEGQFFNMLLTFLYWDHLVEKTEKDIKGMEEHNEMNDNIRIIRNGKEKAWRRFTCKACGCVFEARGNRLEITRVCRCNEFGRFETKTIALATCPECSANVTEEINNDTP